VSIIFQIASAVVERRAPLSENQFAARPANEFAFRHFQSSIDWRIGIEEP